MSEVAALGQRNSVGGDVDPRTGQLWFSENARDWMGDNIPSDKLNHLARWGEHFGYPYCHQGDIPDPKYNMGHKCSEFTPPALNVGPHMAPLGMKFYTGNNFPPEYKNNIFLAEHGGWNQFMPHRRADRPHPDRCRRQAHLAGAVRLGLDQGQQILGPPRRRGGQPDGRVAAGLRRSGWRDLSHLVRRQVAVCRVAINPRPGDLPRPGEAFFSTDTVRIVTVRISRWIVAAISVAIPVTAMAAEGIPAAGKAEGGGRRLLRLPRRRGRRHRGRAGDRQEHAEPRRAAGPLSCSSSWCFFARACARTRT